MTISYLDLPPFELCHSEYGHILPGVCGHQGAVIGARDQEEVRNLVLVVGGQHVDVVQGQEGLLSLGDMHGPRLDVDVRGDNQEVEHQPGEARDAVGHIKDERVCGLIGH